MRKIIIAALLLFVVNLCGADTLLVAQRRKAKAIYTVPVRLQLNKNASADPAKVITEEIYPIGWSKDGKFAFYSEPPDEACGCYFGDLFIQDMRTDKIVWSNEYVGEESNADENIKTHWRRNQKLFDRKLAEYGIVQNKKFALRESPLQTSDDSVKVDFFSDVRMIDEPSEFLTVGNVFVKLISNRKGAKTVYQKSYAGKGYDGVLNIAPGGVLVSPFEPQAAVFLIEMSRGWEGFPYVTQIRVVGASLTTNFR